MLINELIIWIKGKGYHAMKIDRTIKGLIKK